MMDKNNILTKKNYFKVSFRIIGDNIEPETITKMLNILPDNAHKKGAPNIGFSKKGKPLQYSAYNSNLWGINSVIQDSSILSDYITDLLNRLEPMRETLIGFNNQDIKMDFFCGYFFSCNEQPNINLDSNILSRMSGIGINLKICLYPIITNTTQ